MMNSFREVFAKDLATKKVPDHVVLFAKNKDDDDVLEWIENSRERIKTKEETCDFDLVRLVRILFLYPETPSVPLADIHNLPFWLETGETNLVYWTQNHALNYLVSYQVLAEKGIVPVSLEQRDRLRVLLICMLQGYAELGSTVYSAVTLEVLFLLIDFSIEKELIDLARRCIVRIIRDCISLDGDMGTDWCHAQLRPPSYDLPTGHNIDGLIRYCRKECAPEVSRLMAAITSSSCLDAIVAEAMMGAVTHVPRCMDTSCFVEGSLSRQDATLFEWMNGKYFTSPSQAMRTVELIEEMGLWEHPHFKPYRFTRRLKHARLLGVATRILSPILKATLRTPCEIKRLDASALVDVTYVHSLFRKKACVSIDRLGFAAVVQGGTSIVPWCPSRLGDAVGARDVRVSIAEDLCTKRIRVHRVSFPFHVASPFVCKGLFGFRVMKGTDATLEKCGKYEVILRYNGMYVCSIVGKGAIDVTEDDIIRSKKSEFVFVFRRYTSFEI